MQRCNAKKTEQLSNTIQADAGKDNGNCKISVPGSSDTHCMNIE